MTFEKNILFRGYVTLNEKDILKKLIRNDALFKKVHIISQTYDIIPNKNHLGAYIEYQDIMELRDDFINELVDSIVDWIYSSEKFCELKKSAMDRGKSEGAATQEVGRKARNKFRANHDEEKLMVQGQLGELILFHFIQKCIQAIPLLRKMKVTTSPRHERFGADAIHYKIEKDKNIIILGEAKTYTSKYKFNDAFSDALDSIVKTYYNYRNELDLYVHEDFLDDEMNAVAEKLLNNTLENVEIQLVSIVIYNELENLQKVDEKSIKQQIEKIIEKKYSKFDNSKINIEKHPILNRITYIVFPIWDLDKLALEFQKLL